MAGRQVAGDMLAIRSWFESPRIEPMPQPTESRSAVITDSPTDASILAEGLPQLRSTGGSADGLVSGSMAPPTMPIFFSRHGEKYHYSRLYCGLSQAEVSGNEQKTLCRGCDVQRRI